MKNKPASSKEAQKQTKDELDLVQAVETVAKQKLGYEKPPSKYKFRYHKYTGESVPEPTKLAVVAMREAGMSLVEVAAKAGLSTNIVSAIERLYDPPKALIERYKKGMAGRLYRVASDAIEQIEPESLEFMSPYQNMGIAGLAIQNARLIEGQATEIIDMVSLNLTLVEIRDKRAKLLEQLGDDTIEAEEVK